MADIYTPKDAAIDEKGIALALRAASMGSWHWDIAANKRYIDAQGCHLLGLDPQTFGGTGEEFIATIHPDDRPGIGAAIERTLKEDAPYRVEYRTVWPDGSTHYIAARAGLQRDATGKPETMSGIFWDISDAKQAQIALKYEEERLKIIIRTVADPIFVKDNDSRFVLANDAFYTMLGLQEKDVIGKTLAENLPADEMQHFLSVDRQVLDTGVEDIREEPLTTGDRTLTIVTKKTRLVDQFGNRFLVGSIHDITGLKHSADVQQKAFALLKESQLIANLGSYVLDATTGVWQSSEALDMLFGIDESYPRTVEGWAALIHPDDRLMMTNYFNDEVLVGTRPFDKEYRIIRKNDGVVRWVHGLGQLRVNANGRVEEMHGTIQDITQSVRTRLELERAKIAATNVLEDLQAEKNKLNFTVAKDEAILASIGDGLVVTDVRGCITMVNPMFETMTGWSSSEVLGKRLVDILPITDENGGEVTEQDRLITQRLVGSSSFGAKDDRHYIVRKGKTRFPAAMTVTPVLLSGALIGAVEVFRDITKEKELDRGKDEFISIASHQLRTPVSALRWVTEALQHTSTNLDEKQQVYLTDLAESTQRLIDLVEGLLDVSRIQMKSPMLLERSSIEISPFIRRVVTEMEGFAHAKNHTLAFHDRTGGSLTLIANTKSVYNVLQNYVSNAIEYSPEGSVVTVTVEKLDGSIKIAVANEGDAITEQDKPHIFERFYRGEWARKVKISGTGLGLYIAKLLIEEMGGSVGFQSEAGTGTVFWFTLKTPNV